MLFFYVFLKWLLFMNGFWIKYNKINLAFQYFLLCFFLVLAKKFLLVLFVCLFKLNFDCDFRLKVKISIGALLLKFVQYIKDGCKSGRTWNYLKYRQQWIQRKLKWR